MSGIKRPDLGRIGFVSYGKCGLWDQVIIMVIILFIIIIVIIIIKVISIVIVFSSNIITIMSIINAELDVYWAIKPDVGRCN